MGKTPRLTPGEPIDDGRWVPTPVTPPLQLRPLGRAELDLLETYAADARLAATCNVPHPFPEGGGEHLWLAAREGLETGRFLVYSLFEADAFRGLAMLHDVDAATGTAGLAFWVAVPCWGRGLARWAARAACELGFRERGLRAIEAVCLADNEASARVLLACGFAEVDRFVNDGSHGAKFVGRAMRRFVRTP
jgi:RimJ/RimL family protein N-acetyltransferase